MPNVPITSFPTVISSPLSKKTQDHHDHQNSLLMKLWGFLTFSIFILLLSLDATKQSALVTAMPFKDDFTPDDPKTEEYQQASPHMFISIKTKCKLLDLYLSWTTEDSDFRSLCSTYSPVYLDGIIIDLFFSAF